MFERRHLLALILALTLLVPLAPPVAGQNGQGDANGTGDAGNTRAAARSIATGHYFARINAENDPSDWYRFEVGSVTGPEGRPIVEALVRSDAPGTKRIALFGPDDTDDDEPYADGRGFDSGANRGATFLRASLDQDGTWLLRVTGSTGGYELNLRIGPEDDGGAGRDAPASRTAANNVTLTGDFTTGVLAHGTLVGPDETDVFLFNVPRDDARVLAVVRFPETSLVDLTLNAPTGAPLGADTTRTGPGIAAAYRDDSNDGLWAVTITADEDTPETPYVLTVNIDGEDDANQGDASGTPLTAGTQVTSGLVIGALTDEGSAIDRQDAYVLDGIRAGESIAIGGVSHETNTLNQRLQFVLDIHDATQKHIQRLTVCAEAQSTRFTAATDGDYFVRVQAAARVNHECGGFADINSGTYGLFLERHLPNEAGDLDAPATTDNAPPFPESELRRGSLDRIDTVDTYSLGTMSRGEVARIAFAADVTGLEAKVAFLDDQGRVLSETTTIEGVTRVYASTGRNGEHFLRITLVEPDEPPTPEGPYRFFAATVANEPPLPSSLSTPSNGVGRNTVQLRWTQNSDADFLKYEVHQNTSASFTPSDKSRIATYNLRNQTSHTASHLEPGREYTFLIRTFDETQLVTNSNRLTVRTDNTGGPLSSNRDPTLTEARVTPPSGDRSTLFNFSVKYTDANNDPPVRKDLFVDGAARPLTSVDRTYNDGSVFFHETTLGPGEHSFFFVFSDGTTEVRSPSSGSHRGPVVTEPGNRPPTVNASAHPPEGEAPLRTELRATASDPDRDSLSYSWDFDANDGIQNESSSRRVNHTYESPGTFTATVTVTDAKGARSTDSVTIVVRRPQNQPPTVDPRAQPSSGLAPLSVRFTANAQDPDGNITTYSWDFDNRDGITSEATEANPERRYETAGTFVATVTVTDDQGQTATGSVNVVVSTLDNRPPSVSIVASPSRGPAPLVVNFTAAAVDPDGDILTYEWDFDTSNGIRVEATGRTVNHTFGDAGRVNVMVVVRDARGAPATATTDVTITSATANFGELFITATPLEGRAPLRVHLQADTSRMAAAPVDYVWDFGDGSTVEGNATADHTYERQGLWQVMLRVTDEDGAVHESTVEITVTAPPRGQGTPAPAFAVVLAALAVAVLACRRRS